MKRVSVFGGTVKDIETNKMVLREWAVRPIFILGRVYAPLLEKDDTIVYFLEGPELVGSSFDRGKQRYGIAECRTVREFINWWIPLQYNGEERFRKLSTRLELGLSDSLPGIFIMPEDIEIAEDVGQLLELNFAVNFTNNSDRSERRWRGIYRRSWDYVAVYICSSSRKVRGHMGNTQSTYGLSSASSHC
jgi:hypothetical protein